MERIPKGAAICLRKICDSDSKFEMCSAEYQKYKRIETYERSKNLKELISPYVFAKAIKKNNCSIEKCSRKCDICKIF